MAVDGPITQQKNLEGPPVRESSSQTKTISSQNTPHSRWTKRSRNIQRAKSIHKLISTLFMCANIQRKGCEGSTREFSERIGKISVMLNHFQSQRPFRPFRLLAGKHEFKGRSRGGTVLWSSSRRQADCTQLLCFPFMFRVQRKNKDRCEVHAGYASSALDCKTISCFVLLFYFSARTHLAHTSTNSR